MNLKKLVEISPVLIAFLVFNGFLKLSIFYAHWNIRIADYLDFTEILLSFLNDLNVIVLCFVIFILYQIASVKIIDHIDNSLFKSKSNTGEENKKQSHQSIKEIIDHSMTHRKKSTIIICLIVTTIFCLLFLYSKNIVFLHLTAFSIFQLILLCLFQKDNNSDLPFIISIVVTFIFFTYALALRDINTIETKSVTLVTIVETENENIETSASLIYLGKSRNFIYLYNKQFNSSQVIPISRIKKIETTH